MMTEEESRLSEDGEHRDWMRQLDGERRESLRLKKAMAPQLYVALNRILRAIDHRPDLLPAALDHARKMRDLAQTHHDIAQEAGLRNPDIE